MTAEERNIEHYKRSAEEDYLNTPISVLRYISELEENRGTIFKEELEKRVKDADEVTAIINDLNNQLGGLKFGFIPLGDMCRGAYWLIQYLRK